MTDRQKPPPRPIESPREVDVPVHIYVRCPLVGYDLRQLQKCEQCEYFRGLTERLNKPGIPFNKQYQAQCAAVPIDREVFALEQVNDGGDH